MAIDQTVQDGQENTQHDLIGGLFPLLQARPNANACDTRDYKLECRDAQHAQRVVDELKNNYGGYVDFHLVRSLPGTVLVHYKGEDPLFPIPLLCQIASDIAPIDELAKAYALTQKPEAQTR